jgi:hypothetical protein
MPISERWHFTCPITGHDVAQETEVLPDRWARIAGEVYSPEGMYILAWRILKHPEAQYDALLTAPFPSTTFDDWKDSPPTVPGFVVAPADQGAEEP